MGFYFTADPIIPGSGLRGSSRRCALGHDGHQIQDGHHLAGRVSRSLSRHVPAGPEAPLPDALPELPLAVQDVLRRSSTDAGGLARALASVPSSVLVVSQFWEVRCQRR